MKRTVLSILFTILMVISSNAQNLQKVKFAAQWMPQAQFAGYYAAKEKGIYEKYGLDVEIIHCGINNTSQELLLNGEADFASMFLATAIPIAAKGNKLLNILQLSRKSALVFVAKKEKEIKNPEDFSGRKIGIWKSGFEEIPKAFLKKHNIHAEIVPVLYSINMFLVDAIDIMTVMWYNEYHTILNSGINEDEIDTFFLHDSDLNIPEDGIYCLRSTISSDNKLCKKFAAATIEGWSYAFDNREEALELIIQEMNRLKVPANKAHQIWMLDKMHEVFYTDGKEPGRLDETEYFMTARILKDAGKVSSIPPFKLFVPEEK